MLIVNNLFVVSLFSQLPEYGDESLRVCVGVAHLLGLLPVSRTGPVSGVSLVRSRSALPIFAFFSSRAYILYKYVRRYICGSGQCGIGTGEWVARLVSGNKGVTIVASLNEK